MHAILLGFIAALLLLTAIAGRVWKLEPVQQSCEHAVLAILREHTPFGKPEPRQNGGLLLQDGLILLSV